MTVAGKGSKAPDSPAGTASCFGYKGVTLCVTTTKHASGLRSQWQEATSKNPERSPTEAECPRELDVRRAKRRASLGNEWGEVRTTQQWVGADRQTSEDLVCSRPLAPEAH